jgi:hypothetical protein
LANYKISDPTIMGYLRNNSIFTFGRVDRAKTSATFREILDAMWLFNDKFERALSKFKEIKAQQKSENQQLPTGPAFAKRASVAPTVVAAACRLSWI